jgi:ABC-type dipeptide/oligopeptide/nickel transport system permease component
MGIDLMIAVLVLVGILITDIAYALVDPRISYESAEKGAT